MVPLHKRLYRKYITLFTAGLLMLLSYTNCAKSFDVLDANSLNGSLNDPSIDGGPGTTTTTTPTSGSTTTSTTTTTVASTTTTTPTPAPPPPPGTDVWIKLETPPNSGPYNPYFYCPVVRASTGEILLGWGKTFIFKPGVGWTTSGKSAAGSGATVDIGRRENYGCTYDDDHDLAWIGDGAPVAYGLQAGLQSGELAYNFNTENFSLEHRNYTTPKETISGGDSAFLYHKNKLWRFGGFSVDPSQMTASLDLGTKEIVRFSSASITNPPWSDREDYSRLTYARSGILNRSTGTFWTFADNNEFWTRDMNTGQWTLIPTTGSKPTSKFFVADYDEYHNVIVAWVGSDSVVGVSPVIQVQGTWILDVNTRVWRKSLSGLVGHTVPPGVAEAGNMIRYDRYNKRMIMTVAKGYTEVWAFYLGTPPP